MKKKKKAFTLVEVLYATSIGMMVVIGVTSLFLTSLKSFYWSTNKCMINNDFRMFTMHLADEVRAANAAYVYESFSVADRNSLADRKGVNESGDCLVLIYTTPHPNVDDPRHVTDIVVYFRQAEEDGIGPVYRFEHSFGSGAYVSELTFSDSYTVESILSTIDTTGPYQEIIELSRGLADGELFQTKDQNKTIIVNGEIMHGNSMTEVTNTYNLTLSPRG